MQRKKLGELLLNAGVITPTQLNRALAEQSRWNAPLGRILVDLGMLTEEKLVKALSYQLNLPIADLEDIEIPPRVLSFIPAQFCQENGLIPFREDPSGRFLDVAMIDPMNLDVVENLRVMTSRNIRSYFATYSAMARAMIKFHGLALKTTDGPAPMLSAGLDAREISPSGYHLAAASGAPIREIGSQTLETEASAPLPQNEEGLDGRFSERISSLEHEIAVLGRELKALAQNATDKDQVQRFSQSLKALASAVTELKSLSQRTEQTLEELTKRLQKTEALQERDERVLRKLLGLLVSKNVATSEELRRLLERA